MVARTDVSMLFTPLKLGALTLPNRIVMAPLTRSRAGETRVPNALMAAYYGQRADAGLILSEATSVSPEGVGYAGTPGIWSDAQVAGWRRVTHAVHDRGGRIAMQLWHVGRISDPVFLDGALPVAPSAIRAGGTVSLLRPKRPYVTPRPLSPDELPGIVAGFRLGAENAMRAGFDGVEIHAANGYLLEQFLQDQTNRRGDAHGGSVENRCRLVCEIADALIPVWGADRVGLHLSPRGDDHDIGDSDPKALFTHLAAQMKRRGLGYVFLREYEAADSLFPDISDAFGGPVIINEKLTVERAARLVGEGRADAVAFGKDFIATPDLVARIRDGAALNTPDPATFYVGGARGYTDYPLMPDLATAPASCGAGDRGPDS
ncbi:alkene reductase [Paracoccus pacificus]|uniref:Alkene reductase n=1 Tax=Paracoccus pacificus TaxID=1463598 RepID=A0ABW4R2R0_9RHOB